MPPFFVHDIMRRNDMGMKKEKNPDKVIAGIVKDMKANRSVEDIAHRNGVDLDYVRDVLQIYTTHRDIDVQGIIERLAGKEVSWT